MRPSALRIYGPLLGVIAAFAVGGACGKSKKGKNESSEQRGAEAEVVDNGPFPAGEFDELAKATLAALGKSPDELAKLRLQRADLPQLVAALAKACPEKFSDTTVEERIAEHEEKLGSDQRRLENLADDFENCQSYGDFSKAQFRRARPVDPTVACGIARSDAVWVEAEFADGKPIFVLLDDPVKTTSGWRLPEGFRCTSQKPQPAPARNTPANKAPGNESAGSETK